MLNIKEKVNFVIENVDSVEDRFTVISVAQELKVIFGFLPDEDWCVDDGILFIGDSFYIRYK